MPVRPDDADLRLPADAVLVHIGPYKTGSTAIQTTLALHRDDMAPHGVAYPGDGHRQMRPTWALIQRGASGVAAVPMSEWDELAAEIRAADGRVVISSEDLASAKADQARKLVEDVGADRVHVLVVVRRLDKLFPSSWQERVKSWNETRTYDEWLREVLDPKREGHAATTFWRNHGVQNLVGVWGKAVSLERVVLLVADESDRSRTATTFERLLGLPAGLLTPGPRENTSLSMDKIELYRRVNELFKQHGWSDRQRRELIYRGMLHRLRQVEPLPGDVPIPQLPPWFADRVEELNRIRAHQVRGHAGPVIGDPDLLEQVDVGTDEEWAALPDALPIESAVAAIEGIVEGAQRLRRQRRKGGSSNASNLSGRPADIPAHEVAQGLVGRARSRLSRRGGRGR